MTEENGLKLKTLHISENFSTSNKDFPYSGSITFENRWGETKFVLTGELSNRVLAACADELVHVGGVLAEEMRKAVLSETGQLVKQIEGNTENASE